MKRFIKILNIVILLVAALLLFRVPWSPRGKVTNERVEKPRTMSLPRLETASAANVQPARSAWHPPHIMKVWTTEHKGRIFRVIQLPRCEHIEAVIAYNPSGETVAQAKQRLGGAVAMTGSFHHPRTFALADFLQKDGAVYAAPSTGRCFLAMHNDGKLAISNDYSSIKGKRGVSALALGQRLVPLQRDGFSVAFMNRVTDRMAIGMNDNFIFIVQGKSDIWRLAHFMGNVLPCDMAVNSDGGHVVRGVAPVHVVFRWKTSNTTSNCASNQSM